MAFSDSVDKVVFSYFAAVTSQPFTYKGKKIEPKRLRVSEGIFRDYICRENCGGCCVRFSLDYLPTEKKPLGVNPRVVIFDGREIIIHSDLQEEGDHFCGRLRRDDARCGIHGVHPFTCDFELIRAQITHTRPSNNLTTMLFSRGWNMTKIDGQKGARCSIEPATRQSTDEVVRKLVRLEAWAVHFGISTCLPSIIEWAKSGPHQTASHFNTHLDWSDPDERRLSLPVLASPR